MVRKHPYSKRLSQICSGCCPWAPDTHSWSFQVALLPRAGPIVHKLLKASDRRGKTGVRHLVFFRKTLTMSPQGRWRLPRCPGTYAENLAPSPLHHA